MAQTLRAVYQNGAFVPQGTFELPEGTEVELSIQSPISPALLAPPISDPEAKRQFLRLLMDRMQRNPIPTHDLCLTRDRLHERC